MTKNMGTRLRVHPDLRYMVAPLSEESRNALSTRLIKYGCSTPIRVWENIVLVDYEAFEICKANGIPMNVSRIRLENMNEAIAWVCKNQLLRKDIPDKLRHYLIGKRFLAERALGITDAAKDRNTETDDDTNNENSTYEASGAKICVRLGLEYHICYVTVRKYGTFAGIIDYIRSKEPALADKILSGKIRISHEHLVEISQLSSFEFSRVARYFLKPPDRRPTYTKYRMMVEANRKKEPNPTPAVVTGTIKDMPVYDPDGEVCSLALTIPSWIGSINRTQTLSDFSKVSESAGVKLIYELERLLFSVEGIRAELVKEVYHGRS